MHHQSVSILVNNKKISKICNTMHCEGKEIHLQDQVMRSLMVLLSIVLATGGGSVKDTSLQRKPSVVERVIQTYVAAF